MGIFKNIFSKQKKEVEEKSYIQNDYLSLLQSIIDSGANTGSQVKKNIGMMSEIFYYLTCKPVSKSIDLIAGKMSVIPPILKNKKTGDELRAHPVLSLLNSPNSDMTREEFLFRYAAFYLITGNSFIHAIGFAKQPPSELKVLMPQSMNYSGSTIDDTPDAFEYRTNNIGISFKYTPEKNVNRYLSSGELSELWHVKTYNPELSSTTPFGVSLMNSIQLEIKQHTEANRHNLSMLLNGARLSGILSTEGSLTKNQREFLKEQFRTLYQGAENAGKTLFAEGGKTNYNAISATSKDMDFFLLKKDNKFDIYDRFNVPLPLVSPDHMTMDNYSEAKLALYDDAVTPLADTLLSELERLLFPRYRDLQNSDWMLTYSEQDIPALKRRSDASIKNKQETGAFTTNEIRNLYGMDNIPGGDTIYQPINLVPIGSAQETMEAEKSRFIDILRSRGFSENQIQKLIEKHYA